MNDKSQTAITRAEQLMPGGVNSPVRAFRAVGGHPPFIARAQGARIYDIDGHEYVDFVGSWGPAIVGHANPAVVKAVQEAAARGLSFGAPTELEVTFAERLAQLYPSIEMLRCVSSGTEATMSALRVARGATGRDCIVKFSGGYHGHSDGLLVKAGSGAATFGAPDSAGVPRGMAETTLVAEYNDLPAMQQLFAQRGDEIAAVIVEPVAGNMGCVPPKPEFLPGLIEVCERHGALCIFDEVMTGCRLAAGGAQQRFGLRPHLTCLGKVVGGGMPLAVYGGKREVMQQISPVGPVYQAGTLSGNPLAVSAGMATLEQLTPALYEHLERLGEQLESGLRKLSTQYDFPLCVQRVGSMITLFFHPGPVNNWPDASQADTQRFGRFHAALLAEGVYWPPAQFEAAFISGAHSEDDMDVTLQAMANALARC